MLTWLAPVPKSICVSLIPSALTLTAPLLTSKLLLLKLAIPLLLVVASSPDTVPLEISIPSPA